MYKKPFYKRQIPTIILTQLLFIFFLALRALENDDLGLCPMENHRAFFKRLALEAPVLC